MPRSDNEDRFMKERTKLRGYLGKIIQPGESIVHQANLHWVVYIWAIISFSGGIALLWFAIDHRQEITSLDNWKKMMSMDNWMVTFSIIVGPLFTFIIAPFEWLGSFVKRCTTELVVTDRRVIAKVGFIRRRTWEINRDAIEGVQVDQSILGRILGFGTITVMGRGRGIAPIEDVDNPLTFRNHIPFT